MLVYRVEMCPAPDGEETIPGKRETTSRRRVIF